MVERSEIDQMAKFMAAMNDLPDTDNAPSSPTVRMPVTDASGVAEMKTILERFHAVTDSVVMEAPIDRELREALVTTETAQGARIGSWEIRVHGKRYDVVNIISGEPLATDLLLYEAARGLVRILNEGGRINSHDAIELLRAEQEYGSLVQDMVLYKHRLSKNTPRAPIFEARYGDAKRRAVVARDRVCRLANGY